MTIRAHARKERGPQDSDKHVPVKHECQATEHTTLGNARLVTNYLSNTLSQSRVERHLEPPNRLT